MALNAQRALARATKLGINTIAGMGNKARQANAQYKASPRFTGNRNLQPQQFGGGFNWFEKTSPNMMNTYPWSGGKHAASTQAQSAQGNAYGKTYVGKRRSGNEKDPDMVGIL